MKLKGLRKLPYAATLPRGEELKRGQEALEQYWQPSKSRGTTEEWWACYDALLEQDLYPSEIRLLKSRLPQVEHWTVASRVKQLEALLDELEAHPDDAA